MRIVILPDYDRMSHWAAEYITRRIQQFPTSADRLFTLGLPTGGTPLKTYEYLAQFYRDGRVSFRGVSTFNMDEYVGLPEQHPQSYHTFMNEKLFSHVDINSDNVHIPDGNAENLQRECAAYERVIVERGGIRLFVGGLGHDGHVAFNEPGSSLQSRTRVKTLTMETRRANARFFDNDAKSVPKQAITVGLATLMDADEVLLLVSGDAKARALRKIVEDGINHMWTGSILQMHRRAVIVCDEAATAALSTSTVKYFKDIEDSLSEAGADPYSSAYEDFA
ncbi:MAG: glucosamine-6-phosphate deaminase [Pirellulales bacterium]|nr:glucosamine-6-phosphate deaminase [Pirellulales bacterium]